MHLLTANNEVAYKADSVQQSLSVVLELLRPKSGPERDTAVMTLSAGPKVSNFLQYCPMGRDLLIDLLEYRYFATSTLLKGTMYDAWGSKSAHVSTCSL